MRFKMWNNYNEYIGIGDFGYIDVGDIDLSDYYTKSEIDDKLDEIGTGGTVDLSNYYKKSETYNKSEIDATIGNINTILNNVLYNK